MSRSDFILLVIFIAAGATWNLSPSQRWTSTSEISSLQSSFIQKRQRFRRQSAQETLIHKQTDRLSDLSLAPRSLATSMNWALPQYYSTTSAVAVSTFIYYINRSPDGIMVSEFDTVISTWTKVELIPVMTDSEGWNVEMRYSTIRSEVVGSCIYIYGRGASSTLLVKYNVQTSNWEVLPPFAYLTDAAGFTLSQYYKTVRMVALSTSLYVLARDSFFFYLAAFDTQTQVWSMLPTLSSASAFWSQEKYYATIRVAVEASRLWVFARVPSGINLVAFDVNTRVWSALYSNPNFSDSAGDSLPCYYFTAQFVSLGGYLYMGLRRSIGEVVVYFDTSSHLFSSPVLLSAYTDASQWNYPKNYMMMQMHVCGGKPVVGGRANAVYLQCSFTRPSLWTVLTYVYGFGASLGWEAVEAYMSVQQVCVGSRLFIVGRKDTSLTMSSQDVLANTWRAESSLTYNCDSSCATCIAAGSASCLHCFPGAHLTGTAPTACACDSSRFPTPDAGNCVECGQGCVLCGGASPNCSQCVPNAHLISASDCGCDAGYFFSGGVCAKCDASCLACKDTSATDCVECWAFAILQPNGSCKCEDSYFLNSSQCQACDSDCHTCINGASTGCVSCFAGAQLQGVSPSPCVCAAGYYPSPTVANCLPCPPRCLRCSSASECLQCIANAVPTDCACTEGYYISDTECAKCSEGCERCQVTGCLKCSASWVMWGSECRKECPNGFVNQLGACVEAIPSPELSYLANLTLRLNFTKAIARELQSADIVLRVSDLSGVDFAVTWEVAVTEVLCNYTIRLFFAEMPTTRSIAEVDFVDPFAIGVTVSHLSTYIPVLELHSNHTQLQPAPAAAAVGQSAVATTVVLSIFSGSPTSIFSLLNQLQVVSYIPLMQWKIPSELMNTLIALSVNSFVYNPLTLIFDDTESVPPQFAEDFYSSGLFLLNSSLAVSMLIGTLLIFLTLELLTWLPLPSVIRIFCQIQLRKFKWGVPLRLWIQLYLDLGVSSLVQFVSSRSLSPVCVINLVVAGLTLALFAVTPVLYISFVSNNKTLIASRQNATFNATWGELFQEFRKSTRLRTSAYYSLFLAHRALYAVALVLLPTHPHLQRVLALAPSACVPTTQALAFLLLEHPFHGRIHAVGTALSEGTTFMVLCLCVGAEFLPHSCQDTVARAGKVLVFAGILGVAAMSFVEISRTIQQLLANYRNAVKQVNKAKLAGSSRAWNY